MYVTTTGHLLEPLVQWSFKEFNILLSQLIMSLDSSMKFFLLFWPEICIFAAYNDDM